MAPPEGARPKQPDKPLGNTLELNSAYAIWRLTPEDKAHRGTKYTENSPWSGARASPHRAYPSAHHPANICRAPILPPDEARAGDDGLHSPDLRRPSLLSTSSTSATRPSHTLRTPQAPSRSS